MINVKLVNSDSSYAFSQSALSLTTQALPYRDGKVIKNTNYGESALILMPHSNGPAVNSITEPLNLTAYLNQRSFANVLKLSQNH